MSSPMDKFFELGDKVTGGDPLRKANWDYYMLWVIFCAFFSIFVGNLYNFFFVSQQITSLGWAVVMLGILWFQYSGLKQYYGIRKMMKENVANPKEEKKINIESVEEMMKGFKKNAKSK